MEGIYIFPQISKYMVNIQNNDNVTVKGGI